MSAAGNAEQKGSALRMAHFTREFSVNSRGTRKAKDLHRVVLPMRSLSVTYAQVGSRIDVIIIQFEVFITKFAVQVFFAKFLVNGGLTVWETKRRSCLDHGTWLCNGCPGRAANILTSTNPSHT